MNHYIHYGRKHYMNLGITEKRCVKCHEIKPVSQFNYDKRRWNGLTTRCKSCINAPRVPRPVEQVMIKLERMEGALKPHWQVYIYGQPSIILHKRYATMKREKFGRKLGRPGRGESAREPIPHYPNCNYYESPGLLFTAGTLAEWKRYIIMNFGKFFPCVKISEMI